jgi:hypothetical protein
VLTHEEPEPWYTESRAWRTRARAEAMKRSRRLFRSLFLLLRISPSYEIARQVAAGQVVLPPAPTNLEDTVWPLGLPRDLDRVLLTFTLFGDVQRMLYPEFWYRCIALYEKPIPDWQFPGKRLPLPQEPIARFLYSLQQPRADIALEVMERRVELLYRYYGDEQPKRAASHVGIVGKAKGASTRSSTHRDRDLAKCLAESAARGMFPRYTLEVLVQTQEKDARERRELERAMYGTWPKDNEQNDEREFMPYDYLNAMTWDPKDIRKRIEDTKQWESAQGMPTPSSCCRDKRQGS